MKKISVLLFVLCAMMWSENSSAQNTITFWKDGMSTVIDNPDSISFKDYFNPLNIGNAATYWKDGQSTVVNEPDSMFIYNFEKVYKDFEPETITEPTELEKYLMQLSSDEDSTPFANYSEEDSLRYDSLAQEVIRLFAYENEQSNNSPKNIKADWIDDDEYAQEAIRENGINRFSSNITIEQQDWDCKDWGNSRYARHDEFKTFYNTFYENGKRTLLVVFYYEGGFPNDKTAYLRVGQVNVGKVKEPINIKAGSEYNFLKIYIDDFLGEHGCVNFFPVIKNKDSKLEKQQYYLNPFFIKTRPIVAEDWNKKYFGYEFGTIDNISVRYNKDSYRDRNLSTEDGATYQCVNLCARYLQGFGCVRPSIGWGNAKYWPERRKNEKDNNGVDKYIVFSNNGSSQVREGDIIAWEHGDFGHVAVVIKTTPDYISIAHQNGGSKATPIGTTLSIIDGIIKDLKYDVNNKRPTNNKSVLGWPITTIIRINCQNEHRVDFKSSMRINTTNITFEDTDINGNNSRMPFTIKNTSPDHQLVISSIEFSKGIAFSTDAVPCTIDPGRNETFYVTFSPKQRASFVDYLIVKSNADDNPTWRINLSGNGIGEVLHSTIKLIPSSIEFGTVPKGVPESRHFVIQNTGLYDLRFRVEQPSAPFNIPEAGNVITVPAGEHHTMEVICTGLEPGEVAENVFVKITSDATNKDEVTGITLSANGGFLPLQLSTKVLSLTMGNQSVVDITSGSGSYSIEKIEPEGVVTASISENRISIEALTAGTAFITIKDDKSEERATIEVYVTANLALASYTMELTSGETKTVEITSGSGNYTVESDNPNVAQADEKDGLVTIIGRRPSTEPAIITVTDNVSKQTATITVTVMNATDYSTGEAIDLGLPSGTLWASCNIGASSEVEPGSFFAWGETETKQTFYKSNYQYYDSSTDTYKSLGYNISGTQYDAAHFIWGGAWRMPTMADFKELRDNCQTRWTTYKGVICKQYTGPNGNSIYMPAAGYYSGDVLNGKDEAGYYWSADLYPKDERYAYLIVTENSSQNTIYYGGRSLGATIRPVQKSSIPEEERITQVVPEEYLDVLDDHITIYKGNNPPNIEGEYLVEPCTMLYDSEGGFNVGHEFSPKQIKISNQDILNNTVDYEDKQASSVNKGIGSFISGDGDNFSVFFNTEGVSHYTEYDIYSKRAMIVSGTKTAEGIRNLTYAFIITSESDDPKNKHMDVGDYRVIHDGDGLAENYPWDTPKSSKKRSVNESETLLPDSSNDSNATRNSVTEKNNDVQVICIE